MRIDEEEELAEARTSTPGNRRWWIIGSIGVAAMTATAVWLGLAMTAGNVHWYDSGFRVQDDTLVEVRFDLTRDPDRAVMCRVEALDATKRAIGSADVVVEPDDRAHSRQVVDVRTVARATTGYVDYCWYADEEPPSGM